jgi:hypothetical protein
MTRAVGLDKARHIKGTHGGELESIQSILRATAGISRVRWGILITYAAPADFVPPGQGNSMV